MYRLCVASINSESLIEQSNANAEKLDYQLPRFSRCKLDRAMNRIPNFHTSPFTPQGLTNE